MASLIAWPIACATAGTTLLPSRLMQSTLMGTPRAVRAIAAFPMSSSAGSRKRRLEGHRNSLSPRLVPCGGRSAGIPSRPLHGLLPGSRLVTGNGAASVVLRYSETAPILALRVSARFRRSSKHPAAGEDRSLRRAPGALRSPAAFPIPTLKGGLDQQAPRSDENAH